MAAKEIASVKSHQVSRTLPMALASAVLEWLLLLMLLIDAIYSYLVTKFARRSKLQVPCLLCSRLDHVLGSEKHGFYWDLICSNHKLEISSLVLCHVHNKLVDVHGMCEGCLFSFATINKSNAETYRLLVGKMGADHHSVLDQAPLFEDHELGDLSTGNCSCCNVPCILRIHSQKLLQTKSVGSEVAELNMPLSIATEHEPSGSLRDFHMGKKGFDPMPHVEYTKVKINSDTESEVPFSDDDDDDGRILFHETTGQKEDFAVQCVQMEPRNIVLADDLTSDKLVHLDSIPELSLLDSPVQPDVIVSHASTSVTSTATIGHGLDDFCWLQVEPNIDASADTKFASLDEVPQSANVLETLIEESTLCLDDLGTGVVKKECGTEISERGNNPATQSDTSSEINHVISDTNSPMPNNLDLGDAYKLAVGNKGRQFSGKLLEKISLKDSARVGEDLKLLLSQISATRGVDLPLNDMSPRVSGHGDEVKTDSSGSIGVGMQILQKMISLERNESGLSLDGSIVSEIDGESEVDRLKRQVEHDKKLMGALYKELEEERNASAVAANQAMAMITKLQEEKAAFHMEALQCLRMMEDQSEYDVEALQKANDLLSEKEKEIQDLEAELELYRDKFADSSMLENELKSTCDKKAGEVRAEDLGASCFENIASVQSNSMANKPPVEFEDEKLYVLQCLKKLEKKLLLFSNDEVYLDPTNTEYSGVEEDRMSDLKEINGKGETQESRGKEENDSSMQKPACVSEESPCAQDGCLPSCVDPEFVSQENSEVYAGGRCYPGLCRLTDVVALRDSISSLIGRLEALEADRNSLEHSLKSHKREDEELKAHLGDIYSPDRIMKDCD
ncbi:hypothetical protein U1Q18_022537 [Sarracenia purpurea var. burkii]